MFIYIVSAAEYQQQVELRKFIRIKTDLHIVDAYVPSSSIIPFTIFIQMIDLHSLNNKYKSENAVPNSQQTTHSSQFNTIYQTTAAF